jgi:plasmid stabilization system protein ParE
VVYRVNLAQRAERDLDLLYEAIGAEQTAAALQWYQGLKRAVFSLEENPLRCPITPEDKRFRHLLFGKKPHVYRVIYRVVLKTRTVHVLHIRHGAMDEFSPEELAGEQ